MLFILCLQMERLHLLLTIRESAMDVPTNVEARRRIAFFTNSMFMDMPPPPKIRNMLSFRFLFVIKKILLIGLKHLLTYHDTGAVFSHLITRRRYCTQEKNWKMRMMMAFQFFIIFKRFIQVNLNLHNICNIWLFINTEGKTVPRRSLHIYFSPELYLQHFIFVSDA